MYSVRYIINSKCRPDTFLFASKLLMNIAVRYHVKYNVDKRRDVRDVVNAINVYISNDAMYTDVHTGMRMKYERSFEKSGIVKRSMEVWKI